MCLVLVAPPRCSESGAPLLEHVLDAYLVSNPRPPTVDATASSRPVSIAAECRTRGHCPGEPGGVHGTDRMTTGLARDFSLIDERGRRSRSLTSSPESSCSPSSTAAATTSALS